ncbi:MAG: hypothetical protein CVV60_06820, partial [Tenericutes bacterium HGW-Tenericutes-5]
MSQLAATLFNGENPASMEDFFQKYPPGMYYLTAIYSFIFGNSFISLKFLYSVTDIINIIIVYKIGIEIEHQGKNER